MNKTSKDLDLSSIITQVSKDDDANRAVSLTNTVITSGNASNTKSIFIIIINKKIIHIFILFSKHVHLENVVLCPFYSVV